MPTCIALLLVVKRAFTFLPVGVEMFLVTGFLNNLAKLAGVVFPISPSESYFALCGDTLSPRASLADRK